MEVNNDIFVLLVMCIFGQVFGLTGNIGYGNYASGGTGTGSIGYGNYFNYGSSVGSGGAGSYAGGGSGGTGSYTGGGSGGAVTYTGGGSGVINTGGGTGTGADTSCYTTDASPYRLYGSKTDYNDIRMKVPFEEGSTAGCIPKFIYLLARHGSRSPTSSQLKDYTSIVTEIQQLVSLSRGTICGSDYMRIKAWRNQFSAQDGSNELTRKGYDAMYNLGVRYKRRFPTLLKQPFNPREVHIQHTYYNKTRDSAVAFTYAIYNRKGMQMNFLDKESDKLLRYYSRCDKYVKTAHTVREQRLFMNGPTVNQVLLNVNRRLGLPDGYLTLDGLDILWDLCRYEHVLLTRSPWCAAFSKNDVQVLEYAGDIRDSHRSYARAISADMTCALMKDIMTRLRTGHTDTQLAALRFTHSITLQAIYARLGLFRDVIPLMSDNMASQSRRRWRTSRNAPYGGHIAFVLYSCTGKNAPKLRVRVLVNEAPIVLPSCSSDLCDIDTAFGALSAWSDTCSYDKICAGNEKGPVTPTPSPLGQGTTPTKPSTTQRPTNNGMPTVGRIPYDTRPASVVFPHYPRVTKPATSPSPVATIRSFVDNARQYTNMMCPNTIVIYVSNQGIQTVVGMAGVSSPHAAMLNSGVETNKLAPSPPTLDSKGEVGKGVL